MIHERFQRARGFLREKSLVVFWTLVLGAVLTRTGTDHDDPVSWVAQFGFWCAHVGAGLLITAGVMGLLQARFSIARPNLWLLAGSGLLGALAFTPLALLLDEMGAGFGWLDDDSPNQSLLAAAFSEFLALAPVFVGMWLVVQLPLLIALRESNRAGSPESSVSPDSEPDGADAGGFMTKLPPALGRDVLLIEADLNYVHVTTRLGKTMFLYSLRQAAEELGDRGLTIHRGVWVAKSAVARVRRRGQHMTIELELGEAIQVSRRRQAAVIAEFGSDYVRESPMQET